MQNRVWKSAVFRTSFIVYLLMLVLPLVGGNIIYRHSMELLEQEIKAVYSAQLEEAARLADMTIACARNLAMDMQSNEQVRSLARHTPQTLSGNRYSVYEVHRLLYSSAMSNEYGSMPFEQTMLIFPSIDMVVTPSQACGSELYGMIVNGRYENIGGDWLAEYTTLGTRLDIGQSEWLLQRGDTILYFNELLTGSYNRRDVILALELKPSAIFSASAQPEQRFWLMNAAGVSLTDSAEPPPFESIGAAAASEYMVLTRQSGAMNVRYVVTLPKAALHQRLSGIRTLFYIEVCAVLLLCAVIACYAFARSYKPLRSLTSQAIELSHAGAAGNNEYDILGAAIKQAITSRTQLTDELNSQRKVLTRLFSMRLVKGLLREYELQQLSQLYEIELSAAQYRLLLIDASPVIGDDSYPEPDEWRRARLVQDALEAGLSVYRACAFEVDGEIACMIQTEADAIDALTAKLSALCDTICEALHVNVSAVVSYSVGEPMRLYEAHMECTARLERLRTCGEQGIVYCDESARLVQGNACVLSAEIQQRLVNALRMGDGRLANSILDELDLLQHEKSVSPVMLRLLYIDVLYRLLQCAGGMNEADIMSAIAIQQFIEEGNAQVLRATLSELIGSIAQFGQAVARKSNLSARVLKYVEEHYADPALSMKQLGDVMNLSASYLSREFLKQTGEPLTDVIARMRVARAKQIMQLNSALSMAQVSAQVGYSSPRTFSRAFQRFEGILPGDYRSRL